MSSENVRYFVKIECCFGDEKLRGVSYGGKINRIFTRSEFNLLNVRNIKIWGFENKEDAEKLAAEFSQHPVINMRNELEIFINFSIVEKSFQ